MAGEQFKDETSLVLSTGEWSETYWERVDGWRTVQGRKLTSAEHR
jgi:hypothetical protein